MIDFAKKEVKHFIIACFIVTIVFAFNDGKDTLVLSNWLKNFVAVFFGVILVMLAHTIAHKVMAKRYGGETEFRMWSIIQYGFKRQEKFPKKGKLLRWNIQSFPLGAVLSLLITLVSLGRVYVILIEEFLLKEFKQRRIGFRLERITEKEIAKIAIAGSIANILFAFILQNFNSSGIFDKLVLMNSLFAVFHMIPFSSLDGAKVLAGSRPLYAFGVSFIIISIVLMQLISPGIGLILATVLAFVTSFIVFYRIYNKK